MQPLRTDPELDAAVPPLAPLELDQLRESIATHGFLPANEVVITTDDVVLDGRARLAICGELGITAPVVRVDIPPGQRRWDYVVVTNVRRRHLSRAQLRAIMREYVRRHPELSNRQAAAAVGVSPPTIAKVRREEELLSPFVGRRPLRDQVWFECTFEYPVEGERRRWSSGRAYLRTPAPADDEGFVDLLQEVVSAVYAQFREHPWLTTPITAAAG